MGRAPCCEKKGLKKGPWIPEEDRTLISYIQRYGQGNWRTLPKQAGLLRCGKSCRLRWTNYLRPGIKRGNFTAEEEETILKLHQMLGNRWSAIAATLPGRTDNEIKNYWRTHLKKRLMNSTMMSSTNATETFRNNDHQGDKTVEYHSLGEQPSNCTAIPKKESKFESGSNESMGSEGNNKGGNAPDRKDPDIKHGNFTAEEEDAILKLHQMLGNRWSAIAATLPGRTDNEIKNHWRTHLKKRLMNSTMMSSTNATETFRINDHQGDKTVEYHSLGEQPSDCTAIPKKESKFESGSDGSMGSEGNNMGGNVPDRKDPDLSNEDFWAEVLSETSFSMEVDGGFEVQSSLSYLLSPPMYDVTTISQAWGREDEDNLEYFGGTSLRSFGNFDIYEGL